MTEFTPQPMKLQGKDYLEVAQRVLWLRTEHPDAQVITDVIENDRADGYALIKAIISIPSTGGSATGYGSASRKDLRGPVAAAYLEKAETRAIGRAAAGLGYGTLAALEEGPETLADAPVEDRRQAQTASQKESGVQSPVTAPSKPLEAVSASHRGNQGPTATAQQGARVTSDQLAVLRGLVAAVGMSDDDKIAYLHKYHATQFSQLTEAEAAACITDLQREADRVQPAVAS